MTIRLLALTVIVCFFLTFVIFLLCQEQRLEKKFKKEKSEYEKQIKKNTNAKEQMETGSGRSDFDASLDVLSKLKK